jgi:hypothetical protein
MEFKMVKNLDGNVFANMYACVYNGNIECECLAHVHIPKSSENGL